MIGQHPGHTRAVTMPAGEPWEVLPAEAASASLARRLVAAAVSATGHQELVEAATLLVSEVVTNSLLHAGTDMRLRCHRTAAGIRVGVFDRSPLLPRVRHYAPEASTGRGLGLLSALATRWGTEREHDGKTLWFELDAGGTQNWKAPSPGVVPGPSPDGEAAFDVQLRDASPQLIGATIEQDDELLRELALVSLGGDRDHARPGGWSRPQFDVSPILAAVGATAALGHARADLALSLPVGAHTAAIERLQLVDDADALARDGRLLAAPALPEVAACRHWLYTQISEQAAGFRPQAWALPELLEPARAAAELPEGVLEHLRRATPASVVADDANRIIFVNRAAGELLGWAPEALVGQRLTVLIPPELREAHLAGFSRLQVTGEPRILGSTVQVPALRRDGSRLEVTLTIERLAGCGGRGVFHAVLERVAASSGSPVR